MEIPSEKADASSRNIQNQVSGGKGADANRFWQLTSSTGEGTFKMVSMVDGYEVWIGEVQQALRSINMSMDDWQSLWPFDFQAEFKAGAKADEAGMKANRFWWLAQNRSLKHDCRSTPNCWLPRGHHGSCQPVNSDPPGRKLSSIAHGPRNEAALHCSAERSPAESDR
jgi:hypothetical protein